MDAGGGGGPQRPDICNSAGQSTNGKKKRTPPPLRIKMSDLHRQAHPARIKRRIQTCWYAHLNPCQIHFNCSGGPFFLKKLGHTLWRQYFWTGSAGGLSNLSDLRKNACSQKVIELADISKNDLRQTLNHGSDPEWRRAVLTSLNVNRRKKTHTLPEQPQTRGFLHMAQKALPAVTSDSCMM